MKKIVYLGLFISVLTMLVSCVSTANIDYSKYLIPTPNVHQDNEKKLVMTIWTCIIGTEPSFSYQTTSKAGQTTFLQDHSRLFVAPEGTKFYEVKIEIKNSGSSTEIDMNNTSMKTEKGKIIHPFYSLMMIQMQPFTEKDLHINSVDNAPMMEKVPNGGRQKILSIWYAIPNDDKPIWYDFFGTQCKLGSYTPKN